MPVVNTARLIANRVEAIRRYHRDTGIKRAELDVSGGIDSAVMAGLLVLALGPENCTFAHLAINTNHVQTERAKRLIKAIGGKLAVADFTAEYEALVAKIVNSIADAEPAIYGGTRSDGQIFRSPSERKRDEIKARLEADPTILGSIRSTLRAPLGRAYNRITGGGIRHGTGNEDEDRVLRYFQKGGDGEVDTNPQAMLSKTEVYQMAYQMATCPAFSAHCDDRAIREAYFETMDATPSADLHGNGDQHNDEDEISRWLGARFTYGRLDVNTGAVIRIGTIERVSRFLDEPLSPVHLAGPTAGRWSHDVNEGRSELLWQEYLLFHGTEDDLPLLAKAAINSDAMDGSGLLSLDDIAALLRGARKAECQTRHKQNPNIPTLGTRQDLIRAGILTDDFAAYGLVATVKEPA